jgi:hypothetical protein
MDKLIIRDKGGVPREAQLLRLVTLKELPSLRFALVVPEQAKPIVSVTEMETGFALAFGTTEEEALAITRNTIRYYGIKKTKLLIAKTLRELGPLPTQVTP